MPSSSWQILLLNDEARTKVDVEPGSIRLGISALPMLTYHNARSSQSADSVAQLK